ncbi:MAG: hypothetical protein NZM08_03020 [Chitinophagales bacterium]|nr:hypothetical protein [Chitinophagales bacterium]
MTFGLAVSRRNLLLPVLLVAGWLVKVPAAQAQTIQRLHVSAPPKDSLLLVRQFSYKREFNDTLSRHKEVQRLLNRLYDAGYLEASYEVRHRDTTKLVIDMHLGNRWEWVALRRGNVDPLMLRRSGFRDQDFRGQPVSAARLQQLLNQLITYCENNGYPFAVLRLDSLKADSNRLQAALSLKLHQQVLIDSIQVRGDARLSTAFLQGYLGLHLPAPYDESLLRQAAPRLQQLPFVALTGSPQVTFANDRATLSLPLQRRNASRLHFILGLLPNAQPAGKLLLTGEGDLDLKNAFGRGEQLRFTFSRLNARSAQVFLGADYPYPFRLPFAVEGSFQLLRNDSLYVDVRYKGGIRYLMAANRYMRFFAGRYVVNMVSFDSLQVVRSKQLPTHLDSRENLLGGEWHHRQSSGDAGRWGWSVQLSGEAGNRKIVPNPAITQLTDPEQPDFLFASLYDSLPDRQFRLAAQGNVELILPVFNRQALRLLYAGALLYTPYYLLSDLYRIGGFQLLRGFDEQSVYASQYHLLSAEYRLLLAGRSYLYAFVDGAWIENQLMQPVLRDWPLGLGAGMSFDTKGGVFAVSYALGRQLDNPIQFRFAKIHFGYINYF